MNRRKFIIGTTIAGTSLLANPPLLASMPSAKRKPDSVIIIGSGFSGLTAAHLLRKGGVKVTVLEGRNRIGGRVFSFQPPNSQSQVIELGAEWVGNSHTSLISMCKEFGLELFNNQFETSLTYEGKYSDAGNWNTSPELETFWTKKTDLWEAYSDKSKQKLDKMDWWRFLSNQGFSDRDLLIRELTDSTDFGESIRHTSGYAAFAEYAESSEKNEMDMKIRGGNQMLAHRLADSVGRENILTEHKVVSVEQERRSVKVTCANGKTFTADKLVCTAPTYSVMRINWSPALPAIQTDAMNALQYARIVKIPLEFSERFWQREDFDMITDTPAHYFYHATKNQPGKTGVLISYVTGDKADSMTSIPKERRQEIILDALRPAFGDVRKYLTDSHMHYWATDPFTKGAYAFYGKSQWFDVMPVLRESFMNTHFAGEHLADWQGFMEGAINTGEEVAEQLGVMSEVMR
jgi:monoamine oxidase